MASLWRTQRPRFPRYVSDGNGRDYYIKYNNAGYWEGQSKIYKKPDYEYPKYSNYHTLFHQAAPFKYYASGNGRETYIINSGGLYHEQRPLASFKLDDFLRGSKISIENMPNYQSKRRYLSLGEKKYNNQLKSLEKNLIKRLYKIPKKDKKEDNDLLPNLETKVDNENIETIKTNMLTHAGLNPSKSVRNNYKKHLTISLNDNLDSLFKQSQLINKYEMKNKTRRSNNESDYNIYKSGKVGCRLNSLNSMNNLPFPGKKNYALKRFNTEGNNVFPNKIKNLKLNKNMFSTANTEEKEKC